MEPWLYCTNPSKPCTPYNASGNLSCLNSLTHLVLVHPWFLSSLRTLRYLLWVVTQYRVCVSPSCLISYSSQTKRMKHGQSGTSARHLSSYRHHWGWSHWFAYRSWAEEGNPFNSLPPGSKSIDRQTPPLCLGQDSADSQAP